MWWWLTNPTRVIHTYDKTLEKVSPIWFLWYCMTLGFRTREVCGDARIRSASTMHQQVCMFLVCCMNLDLQRQVRSEHIVVVDFSRLQPQMSKLLTMLVVAVVASSLSSIIAIRVVPICENSKIQSVWNTTQTANRRKRRRGKKAKAQAARSQEQKPRNVYVIVTKKYGFMFHSRSADSDS